MVTSGYNVNGYAAIVLHEMEHVGLILTNLNCYFLSEGEMWIEHSAHLTA